MKSVDVVLVQQKDGILESINGAIRCDEITGKVILMDLPTIGRVIYFLLHSADLWNSLKYGYKGREIVQRIQEVVQQRMERLHARAKSEKETLEFFQVNCEFLLLVFKSEV